MIPYKKIEIVLYNLQAEGSRVVLWIKSMVNNSSKHSHIKDQEITYFNLKNK
jgi:hypothetical protein